MLTAEDVRKITRARLETFWKTFYRPNRAMLAVAGDVDAAKLRVGIEKAFGGWARAAVPARPAWTIPQIDGTRILLVDRPTRRRRRSCSAIRGSARRSALVRRDVDELRARRLRLLVPADDRGAREARPDLRYRVVVRRAAVRGCLPGRRRDQERDHLGGAARVHQRDPAHEGRGPDSLELDKAKGYYAGSYPFKLQTAAGVAQALVAAELHGLGAGYVRELPLRLAAVDTGAAKAAAGVLLHPDMMLVVIIGKAAVIEPQIRDKGIAYEKINFKDPISAASRAAAAANSKKP